MTLIMMHHIIEGKFQVSVDSHVVQKSTLMQTTDCQKNRQDGPECSVFQSGQTVNNNNITEDPGVTIQHGLCLKRKADTDNLASYLLWGLREYLEQTVVCTVLK